MASGHCLVALSRRQAHRPRTVLRAAADARSVVATQVVPDGAAAFASGVGTVVRRTLLHNCHLMASFRGDAGDSADKGAARASQGGDKAGPGSGSPWPPVLLAYSISPLTRYGKVNRR